MPRGFRIGHTRAVRLWGEHGAYSTSGRDAALKRGLVLSADQGSHAVTGSDATLTAPGSGTVAVGSLSHDGPATPEQISLWLPITGTLEQTATATCRYRVQGSSTWTDGHPLYRPRPEFCETPTTTEGGAILDGFAWPIIGLAPGTTYEVEVTVTAAAGTGVRTLTHTTRSLPAAAGAANKTANSAATITSQIATLNPGDVLEIAAGTYTVSPSISRNGTSSQPIYIRGASRTGTVIQGGFVLQNCSWIVFENMTIQGTGTDSGTDASSIAFNGRNSNYTQNYLTIRGISCTGVDRFFAGYNAGEGFLVYNNTVTGNNRWETSPTNFLGSNAAWNDDGIQLVGMGHCAWQNTITGFGDTFSYANHSGGTATHAASYGVHVYRNDIRNGCDDAFEADYARRNCSFYDNRCHNTINATSFDPLYGGPFLVARNQYVNIYRARLHKWNSTQAGMFLYSNTFVTGTVASGEGDISQWYQPNNGAQRSYGYRNNLHVYRGAGTNHLWIESTIHDPIDWTHNAWFPDNQIQFRGGVYANLAAARTGLPASTPVFSGSTQRFQDDLAVTSNPWNETVTLGANSAVEVTSTYALTLAPGSAAKNSGVVIPNITDGYSGAAPDRGASIAGRSLPLLGDQTGVLPYSLPSAGQIVQINGNLPDDVKPSSWSVGQWGYSLFDSYGGGTFVPTYSEHGAYVIAGSGGHQHPDHPGAALFNYSTGLWERLDTVPSVVKTSTPLGFSYSEIDDGPYWEIIGTDIPAPPHPYANLCFMPDGAKGSVIYVKRAAASYGGPGDIVHSPCAHRFDLATRVWSRYAGPSSRTSQVESNSVWDAARNRWWHVRQSQHEYNSVEYLDRADATWKTTAAQSGFPPSGIAGYARTVLYAGMLIHNRGNSLWLFDPDNATAGWVQLTVSGTLPTKENRWAPYGGKFYAFDGTAASNTLTRITPPANPKTGTWVVDTVTLSGPALPARAGNTDPGIDHYTRLHHVESHDCLGWIPGRGKGVYLLKPGS